VLLTGDDATVARAVAAEVGIDEVVDEVHQGQPVLGLRLRRRGEPAGDGRAARPDDRRCGDGSSSVFVVTNSLRLRRFAPLPGNATATTAVPAGRPVTHRQPHAARD
jgi:hypothetical protein